jgi:hypothetical protein
VQSLEINCKRPITEFRIESEAGLFCSGEAMDVSSGAIVGIDPVEVFKQLVRNGYQQTATEFWSENFAYAILCESPASVEARLSMLGEMSRWVRAARTDEQEGDACAAVAEKTWLSIVANGIEEYSAFSHDPGDAQGTDYRAKLRRAWDDADAEILADAMAAMNEGLVW